MILLVYFLPEMITVNKINCRNQVFECSSRVVSKLQACTGRSLKACKNFINKIFKADKLVKNYTIEYKIPGTLSLNIIERKPSYSVTDKGNKNKIVVDNEGYILFRSEETIYPAIEIDNNQEITGEKISQNILFCLQILSDVENVFQVKTGKFTENSLVIELPGNLRVIFPVEGDREALVGSLILISNEIKNGSNPKIKNLSQKINSIDLRYKNPVLVYGNN